MLRDHSIVSSRTLPTFGLVLAAAFLVDAPAYAAARLTVEPSSWNIIGLDSNNVSVGPNRFPVGARVCNVGDTAATNVTAELKWDTTDPLINVRPGTDPSLTTASLAAGTCADQFFEVEVTRDADAYDRKARYYIEVTSTSPGGTITTPRPRELVVERLVSQSRNSVSDVLYGPSALALTSVGSGGTMTLLVGNTYAIRLVGSTATNGYEQIESFLTLPNTVFRILSVETTYTADSSAYVENPSDRLYGDGCFWENDPNSP
ncbi:MAG: hypothetical protein H6Q02_1625, partial [Acidobacteria bacterium]|nr:hypothetical protein [Acidobacteriota bacterium]